MLPMVGPRGLRAGRPPGRLPTLDSGARKALDDMSSVVGSGGAVTGTLTKHFACFIWAGRDVATSQQTLKRIINHSSRVGAGAFGRVVRDTYDSSRPGRARMQVTS